MSLVKNPNAIRLAMIGSTPGNGHPYSWSAMFNGYNREAMTAAQIFRPLAFLTLAAAFAVTLPSALAVDSNPYNTSAGACASNYPGGLDFYNFYNSKTELSGVSHELLHQPDHER